MSAALAWFTFGAVCGLLGMAVVVHRFLVDRQTDEWARIAGALHAERASRCERGQHREVLETKTPHMYLWCQDCDWREEVGIAYVTGSNKKTRRAS